VAKQNTKLHWQIQILLEKPDRWHTVVDVEDVDKMLAAVAILTRFQGGKDASWRINFFVDTDHE
jgi:hypothetical protein